MKSVEDWEQEIDRIFLEEGGHDWQSIVRRIQKDALGDNL